jgi:hypothetical protein
MYTIVLSGPSGAVSDAHSALVAAGFEFVSTEGDEITVRGDPNAALAAVVALGFRVVRHGRVVGTAQFIPAGEVPAFLLKRRLDRAGLLNQN